jgi:hypothetical protein
VKLRALAPGVAALLTVTFFAPVAEATVVKDFTVAATYTLTKCQSAAEFDCIESVGIVDPSGNYVAGSLISEEVPNSPRTFNGNTIYEGTSIWQANSQSITLRGTIDTTFTKGCAGTCSAIRIGVAVADPLKTKVRFTFRTSWFRPMNVQMKALESDYIYEKINGGARWTMEGMGMPYSDYNTSSGEEMKVKQETQPKADADRIFFDFYLHHAGSSASDSYWEPRCADKGFSVQSHNTNATGDPMWDAASESLIFSIFAPHLKSTGELNLGYFKYWASHEFMDCKFPNNTLTKSPKLTIEIINEDGTRSIATTAVQNNDGKLSFYAFGFHFSSPRILIKADQSMTTAPAPTPSATPTPTASHIPVTPLTAAPKKTTITCVKGKTAKKITAVSPKCPTGYKKR